MKELNQIEVTAVSGGISNAETILGCGLAGTVVGALGTSAAMSTGGGAISNVLGGYIGLGLGGALGLGAGLVVGSVIALGSTAWAYYA